MNRPARLPTKTRLRYDARSASVRGVETRARLIAAGLELFGSRGFYGASTRDIAAAAGLHAASLQYYFNDKEGLYLACARDVVARTWDGVAARVIAAEQLLRTEASDQALVGAFCDIQTDLLDTLHGADEHGFLLAARGQAGLGPAAGFRLVHRGIRRIVGVQAAIIGRIGGLAMSGQECAMREMSLNGQVLRPRGARRITAASLATLERVIRDQTSAALRALIATRRGRKHPGRASDSD